IHIFRSDRGASCWSVSADVVLNVFEEFIGSYSLQGWSFELESISEKSVKY
ncbi:unnamed protein product, partial [Allacma fusca]